MAAVKNSKKNVSAVKGVVGGYAFRAPAGTELPKDNTTALDETKFSNMGYISEDGITFTPSYEFSEHKDMNGLVIDKTQDGYGLEIEVTFVETKAAVLKAQYGDENVTDGKGVLTVHDKGVLGERGVWVFELLLKNNRKMRRVCPDCEPTELGEEAVGAGNLFARSMKLQAYVDDTIGDSKVDYIDSTETTATEA